jgi:hypothetical protein
MVDSGCQSGGGVCVCVCGVRPGKRLFFLLGVNASFPGRNLCDFSLCKGMYRKGLYS